MNFNLFIARKLFREHGDVKKVSRPAILIATSGVAVGLAVMIISVCVVLGFKQEISSKVVGFGSHIQIQNYASVTTNSPQPIAVPPALMKEVGDMKGVAHVQRFCKRIPLKSASVLSIPSLLLYRSILKQSCIHITRHLICRMLSIRDL